MSINVDNLLGVTADDDNEDLTKLDRGDTVDTGESDGNGDGDGEGEDQGAGEGEGEGEGSGDAGDEGPGEGAGEGEGDGEGAGEGDGGEADANGDAAQGAAEGAGKGKGKDDKNYAVRFHRERERREQLERELAATQARLKASPAVADEDEEAVAKRNEELDELYERVEAARLEGDHKEASKLQRQIDTRNQEILLEKTRKTSLETTRNALIQDAQERDNQLFDSLLGDLELLVPELDPKNDAYDQGAADAMLMLIGGYTSKGHTASAALIEAAKAIHKIDLRNGPEAPAKPAKAAKPATPAKPSKGVQRAVDASKRQPPSIAARGANSGAAAIDPATLTDEQFDALPESKLAQLRGDTL